MTPRLRLLPALALSAALAPLWAAHPAAAQSAGDQAATMNLMPVPAHVQRTEGALALRSTFAVETSGSSNDRLQAAIARVVRRIDDLADLRHAGEGVTPGTPLSVRIDHPALDVQALEEDESYTLDVTGSGVRIAAPNELGAMHALETLMQLVQPAGDHYELPAVHIDDTPRFAWRGLLIDCGRHFEPLDVLKRNIDGLAAVKMNVFHWHLTEDQGFRIESKLFPALTAKGSDGLFYTQEQARELVAYARARGVRVVPEFEMPGHSTAWLVAYPELASGTRPSTIRREFGVSDVAIDPTREETYTFLRSFLAEMATIFPDAYVHIGGDETPAPDWKTSPRIQAFMRQHSLRDNAALQAYFNTRVLEILSGLHKHMIGWDEVLTPGLPKDVVVQSWRGTKSLGDGARQGYRGILAAPYYLDHMDSAAKHYLADPLPPDNGLSAQERSLVIGGEAAMWAEHLDAHTIDSRIWPRAAAIAERFWSPASMRDLPDMYRRLDHTSVELESLGLRHLTSTDTALRAMTHSTDIADLRIFAQAFQPVSFGERFHAQRTDQLTPLDNFVDAVTPDPPSRYRIETAVHRFLADPTHATADRDLLLRQFSAWQQSIPATRAAMSTSPQLAQMRNRANQLDALCTAAIHAIHLLADGKPADTAWKSSALAHAAAAAKPDALVHIAALDSITLLLKAVPTEAHR